MAMTNPESVAELYERWKREDSAIEDRADAVMDWMREIEPSGVPLFGEMATKLKPFRDLLASHFSRENCMLAELATYYDQDSPEIAAIRRQTERDHQLLLDDLDDFLQRLNQLEPTFVSWKSASHEFDLFFDRLEQHEDQEAESMNAMMPGDNDIGT